MLRSSLTLAGFVAISAAAQAQQATQAQPVTAPVRDGGIYHAATNTWTRKASTVNIGADIIYNNTAPTGYYRPLVDDTLVDEGRLPSPSSPQNLSSRPGCATSYTVDGVQLSYCTDDIAGGSFNVSFFESYASCTSIIGVTPTSAFNIVGPSTATAGTQACWVVTVDLDGPPSLAFALQADGDGTYLAPPTSNTFGWSFASTLPAGTQINTGPIIAGDRNVATDYDGTRWDNPVNYLEDGTGMSTADAFFVEGGSTAAGCYWFGGTILASFHLEVYADACGTPSLGTSFCSGDGTGTACPCANNGTTGNGCANSLFAGGANIAGTGTASISNDSALLTTTNTPNSSVLFFQGTIQQSGGAGVAFGDGKRCAGGSVVRLGTKNAVLNTASYPVGADQPISVRGLITTPGTRTYQGWYRNAAAFCTASTFNLTNGLEVAWGA